MACRGPHAVERCDEPILLASRRSRLGDARAERAGRGAWGSRRVARHRAPCAARSRRPRRSPPAVVVGRMAALGCSRHADCPARSTAQHRREIVGVYEFDLRLALSGQLDVGVSGQSRLAHRTLRPRRRVSRRLCHARMLVVDVRLCARLAGETRRLDERRLVLSRRHRRICRSASAGRPARRSVFRPLLSNGVSAARPHGSRLDPIDLGNARGLSTPDAPGASGDRVRDRARRNDRGRAARRGDVRVGLVARTIDLAASRSDRLAVAGGLHSLHCDPARSR